MDMIHVRKRQPFGIEGQRISLHLPGWILEVIDQEAELKGETRAKVIAYLIYSGLKAHTGRFTKPANNTIKENWEKRGKRWGAK